MISANYDKGDFFISCKISFFGSLKAIWYNTFVSKILKQYNNNNNNNIQKWSFTLYIIQICNWIGPNIVILRIFY